MSVYIKGMEMPRDCVECQLNYDNFGCTLTGKRFYRQKNFDPGEERLNSCPLIPVPDHGRLIDADGDIGVNVTMMQGGKCKVDLIAPTIIPKDREADK